MTVFVTMLVLVVAQVDDSSSITPAPSPSTFSLQQDVGSCDSLCELRCFLQRGIPQLYTLCMQFCKRTCPGGGGGQPGQVAIDASLKAPASTVPTLSLQQNTGGCDSLCELRCFLQRGIPQLYQFCMQLCKLTCPISGGGGGGGVQPIPTPPTPSLSSFAVHHCTSACVDSISTKLGSGIYIFIYIYIYIHI